MLNGIETIFDTTTQMLRHLKKKSFEKNTQDFIDSYGHYFRELTEYVDSISDKERAAEEIADIFKAGRKKIYGELMKNSDADLFELMVKMEEACKEEIIRYLEFSGSEGKAEEIIKEAAF